MAKAAKREILVLNRYAIIEDYPEKGLHTGDIVLHVRNDKNKEYYTTLRRNKAHSCSCSAGMHGRNCYHVVDAVELENARIEARKAVKKHNAEVASQFAASVAPEWFVEMIDAGTIVAPSHDDLPAQTDVSPKVVEIAESLDIPVAEVAAIAVIAAEHHKETTEGKHTDFELPVRSGRKPRKYATELMEKQAHYASVKSQMAEIRERREAEAGNLYKPYALMR